MACSQYDSIFFTSMVPKEKLVSNMYKWKGTPSLGVVKIGDNIIYYLIQSTIFW